MMVKKKLLRKPIVKPEVKMRPLFWKRILIEPDTDGGSGSKDRLDKKNNPSVWIDLEKEFDNDQVDVAEVEKLFAQKKTKLGGALGQTSGKKGDMKDFSALDDKRTKAVGILMASSKVGTLPCPWYLFRAPRSVRWQNRFWCSIP